MNPCRRCGGALDVDGVWFAGQFPSEGLLCRICRVAPPAFERAAAYATYEGKIRELVHLLKYERMRGVAQIAAPWMAKAMLELRDDVPEGCAVVAVPLYRAKQRQRGYNQAALLASAAVQWLRSRAPEWKLAEAHRALVRVKDTRSQFELTPTGRRRNLAGAFAVADPGAVSGRDVLLIDDIYTSGATARACAGVLARAGARRVFVATLTRAQPEMVAMWTAPTADSISANSRMSGKGFATM